MDTPTFGESNTRLMEWRVLLAPADDFQQVSKHSIDADQERCVSEFRKRLQEERAKGLLPLGYGPVTKG